jgi:uncharacterized membrane protein YoaK (UPF0700 family)
MSPLAQALHDERLAIALATTAGFVDAYGFIHYQAYLSYMSGNTTLAGMFLGQHNVAAFAPLAAAIISFLAGVFSGALFLHAAPMRERRSIFAVIAGALGLIAVLTIVNVLPAIVAIVVISFTMGALNTSLSHIGSQSINLTFVTGTLSRLGSHVADATLHVPLKNAAGPWDTHWHRARQLAIIWCGFFVGAVVSAAATPRTGSWGLLVPALWLAVLYAADSRPTMS